VGTFATDPEEKDRVGLTEEDNESSDGCGSHTIELELGANNSDDEKQRAFDKKQDEAFYNKHINPESFFKPLYNEAGPILRAMGELLEHMADRIDIDKQASIKPHLMQYTISHDLHDLLALEGGT
jgi:hypothetical protein